MSELVKDWRAVSRVARFILLLPEVVRSLMGEEDDEDKWGKI